MAPSSIIKVLAVVGTLAIPAAIYLADFRAVGIVFAFSGLAFFLYRHECSSKIADGFFANPDSTAHRIMVNVGVINLTIIGIGFVIAGLAVVFANLFPITL